MRIDVEAWLRAAHEIFPTRSRHNFTLIDGQLQLTLMLDGAYVPLTLGPEDEGRDPLGVLHEVAPSIEKQRIEYLAARPAPPPEAPPPEAPIPSPNMEPVRP